VTWARECETRSCLSDHDAGARTAASPTQVGPRGRDVVYQPYAGIRCGDA
jgi:hypothetical protein